MSTFLAARAADLGTDLPHILDLKPLKDAKRQPLKEHSLSELNRVNSKPTIRVIDGPNADKVYEKSPFPRLPSQVLKPTSGAGEESLPPSPPMSPDFDVENRPPTGDGLSPGLAKPLHLNATRRMSISTTTSNADTLVAHSVFSPTSQRFSIDSTHKSPIGALEPLEELPLEVSTTELPRQDGRGEEHENDLPIHHDVEDDEDDGEGNVVRLPPPVPPRHQPTTHGYTVAPIGQASSFVVPSDSRDLQIDADSSAADSRPSTSHQIRYVSSSESIRPQFASIRPSAVPQKQESELWLDDAPSLAALRKRSHMHSTSLTSFPSQPRLQGNPHLSTIASESDVGFARMVYDSPNLAGPMWPRKRRTTVASSAYSESLASPRLGHSPQTSSSYNSIADVSSRESSAIPEPLFSSSAPIPQREFTGAQHSHNVSEVDDTIGDLQPPPHQLRGKRSGYIVRNQSRTEFKSTYSLGGERWTNSLFPQWARNFYAGRTNLLSTNASRATLGGAGNASTYSLGSRPPTRGKLGRHAESSRPTSTHSTWETIYSASSSRLPSMLRPRARPQPRTGMNVMTASRDSLEVAQSPDEPAMPAEARQLRGKRSLRDMLRRHRADETSDDEEYGEDDGAQATVADQAQIVRQITWRTRSHAANANDTTVDQSPSLVTFPHLVQNKRLQKRRPPTMRVPSLDEPFKDNMFGRGNRQVVAFCLGFILPPLWIVASFLPLPYRPSDRFSVEVDSVLGSDDKGPEAEEVGGEVEAVSWSWDQERMFLKAKWWQTLNRVMSVVGLGIMALIIALAVLAAA